MAITVIRSVAPALRTPGNYVTPSDRIGNNEGGQLLLRLDIPLPDFANPDKRVEYRIEQDLGAGQWQLVVGAGWQGRAIVQYRDPVLGFVSEPADPTNPNHWSFVAIDLDGSHAHLKGTRIRANFDVFDDNVVPTGITAGVVYERRTAGDQL